MRVLRTMDSRRADQMHGLSRTLVSNMVVGVSTGFSKTMSMVGVGYKGSVAGKVLTLNLGYSHPVEMPIPEGLSVEVVKNTTVIVTGFDRELVGQFSANIRCGPRQGGSRWGLAGGVGWGLAGWPRGGGQAGLRGRPGYYSRERRRPETRPARMPDGAVRLGRQLLLSWARRCCRTH